MCDDKKSCEYKSTEDYIHYLQRGFDYHTLKVEGFRMAIKAYKEGFKAGRMDSNAGRVSTEIQG